MYQKLTAQHGFIPLLISLLVLGLLSLSIFYIINKGVQQKQYHPTKAQTSPSITPPESVPDHILLKFKPDVTDEEKGNVRNTHALIKIKEIEQIQAEVLRVVPANRDRVIETLQNDPKVEYAVPDYIAHVLSTPNDPYYTDGSQYAPQKIQAPAAWDISTGTGVTIAFVDTGIDPNHPEFQGRLVPGYNFPDSSTNTADNLGHGTGVAGIAVATTNNSLGIAGIASSSSIMPIKVVGSDGMASSSDIANGITYAADHGARVINVSLGMPFDVPTMHDAVIYARSKGALVVVAAGNNNSSDPLYPGSYPESFTVAGTDQNDARYAISNFGSQIDVAAPAVRVFSTWWSSTTGSTYTYVEGTSDAAPHVAGLAALLFAQNPNRTVEDVKTILRNSADDLGAMGRDDYFGCGRINAFKALQNATTTSCTKPLPTPLLSPTPTLPPVNPNLTFSNISVTNITNSQATISWSTSAPSTSQVQYGTKSTSLNSYTNLADTTTLVTTHTVQLTGLRKGTQYSFIVHSKNSSGVDFTSPIQTFRTAR